MDKCDLLAIMILHVIIIILIYFEYLGFSILVGYRTHYNQDSIFFFELNF